MKRKIIESVKTLVIVALAVSLTLLTLAAMPVETVRATPWLSTVLQPFGAILGLPEAELAYVQPAQPISDAAQPLAISVQNPAGRYTAHWDFVRLDETFETLGGLLGEALDTAGTFNRAGGVQLKRALTQTGVSFDYGFSLPVELLASWLDAASPEEPYEAQMYVLTLEAGQVQLYLVGEDCYCAPTEVEPEGFRALLERFKPDGSRFAFETDSTLEPLSLRPGEAPFVKSAEAVSPCDSRYVETLATALGFNAYDENRYTSSAGVTYFSETNCSLQIGADGQILLNSSVPERYRAAELTLQAQVELARSMVELAAGGTLGDARIYLSGVTREDGKTVCTFDYVLAGVPVSCGREPAGSVTFSGQTVTRMKLLVSAFTLTEGKISVLPPVQAEAILPEGSSLNLEYDRANAGPLAAGWKQSAGLLSLWR